MNSLKVWASVQKTVVWIQQVVLTCWSRVLNLWDFLTCWFSTQQLTQWAHPTICCIEYTWSHFASMNSRWHIWVSSCLLYHHNNSVVRVQAKSHSVSFMTRCDFEARASEFRTLTTIPPYITPFELIQQWDKQLDLNPVVLGRTSQRGSLMKRPNWCGELNPKGKILCSFQLTAYIIGRAEINVMYAASKSHQCLWV